MSHRFRALRLAVLIGVVCLVLALSLPSIALGQTSIPIYRFYNVQTGIHFYTASAAERDAVIAKWPAIFTYEGVAYNVDSSMTTPLYRFYNVKSGGHFYTANESEKASVIAKYPTVFTFEGVAYNVSMSAAGHGPVHRFYNAKTNAHFYTASDAERAAVVAKYPAFAYEGIAFYVMAPPTPVGPDTMPPVTLSDAVPEYRGLAVIRLSASDAGSGVAHTYYILDGGLTIEGTSVEVTALGDHEVEFWSVDAAGNAETPKSVEFTIVSVHANPAIAQCTTCHNTDLLTMHDNDCSRCHTAGVTPSFVCSDCHDFTPATHPGLATAHTATGACVEAGCHVTDVTLIHEDGPGCAACHGGTAVPSTDCADCHTGVVHPALGAQVHRVTGPCYNATCHVTYGGIGVSDAALLHDSWRKSPGCAACHGPSQTPSLTCFDADCHGREGQDLASVHEADHTSTPAANDLVNKACVGSGCHGNGTSADLSAVHGDNCAPCHGDPALFAVVTAGDALCSDCHTDPLHEGAEYPAHVGAHATLEAAIEDNSAGCVSCHGSDVTAVLPDGNPATGVSEHKGCSCHIYHPGPAEACEDCHVMPMDPAAAHPYHVGAHDTLEASIDGERSGACVTCHGSDLLDVAEGEHAGCLCHAYGEATEENTECADCHSGAYAPHGFTNGVTTYGAGYLAAGGHNTTTFGILGALTKWDGSEGVLIRDSADDTIVQEWPLPTSGVFWSDSVQIPDPENPGQSLNPTDTPAIAMSFRGGTDMASKIRTDVGWGSVITCEDCHTDLSAALGPQGANAGEYGLDPNFPDDWTKAEITSFDPTGMRSIETKWESPNPFYGSPTTAHGVLGSQINMGPDPLVGVKKYFSDTTTTTIAVGEFYNIGIKSGAGYSSGVVTGRFICQKCHKLTNSYQGLGIEGNGRGFRSNNMNYMGFANEAHMEHHADMITGQGNCVSCHIAIPHGWKRPRLLVYESDPAPYKVQWVFPQYQTLSAAKDPNADLSQGNWGYLGSNNTATSTYKLIGAPIPNGTGNSANGLDVDGAVVNNTGKTYSSHLERIAASSTAHKELVVGPAAMFADADAANGTTWGLWDMEKLGSEWLPDTSPNALYSGEAIQNNCTACTSAGLTHSDTGGTSEGVAETAVTGRHQSTLEEADPPTGNWMQIPYWR